MQKSLHWRIVSCLTFIFLCGIFSTRAEKGGTSPADSLFNQRQFREAAIAYEREYFAAADDISRVTARLGRAQCQKQLGRFKEAVRDLGEIPLYSIPDSLQQRIRYEIALSCFLDSDFESARSQLEQMHFFSENKPLKNEVLLLEILNDNERFDYTRARETALRWLRQLKLDDSVADSLNHLITAYYEDRKLPGISSEKRANLFSQVIPGTGQAYAGFTGEGLVSLLLHFAALGTGVYAILGGYYFTGYLVGTGLLQKFYFGGLRRTSFLVKKGNYQRTREFNDNARQLFLGIHSLSLTICK